MFKSVNSTFNLGKIIESDQSVDLEQSSTSQQSIDLEQSSKLQQAIDVKQSSTFQQQSILELQYCVLQNHNYQLLQKLYEQQIAYMSLREKYIKQMAENKVLLDKIISLEQQHQDFLADVTTVHQKTFDFLVKFKILQDDLTSNLDEPNENRELLTEAHELKNTFLDLLQEKTLKPKDHNFKQRSKKILPRNSSCLKSPVIALMYENLRAQKTGSKSKITKDLNAIAATNLTSKEFKFNHELDNDKRNLSIIANKWQKQHKI